MSTSLVVLAAGQRMGQLTFRNGKLRFLYDERWTGLEAFPLSTSMPIAGRQYEHATVYPFLANLLPDNENTLSAWSKELHTSTHPFALLRHRGKDCPGAIQIVPEEEVEVSLSGREDGFEALSPAAIAARLRDVREAARSGKRTTSSGQFSLAGAQPKISLALRDGAWSVPFGRHPTTHILKPTVLDDGLELNEHFCLELARALGLLAAKSRIERFEDETAIVVERYDRDATFDPIRRIHQEDLCQALAVPPSEKYQNEGGPSAAEVIEAIRGASDRPSEDAERFLDALLFHFLIVGTDAHAKNYSLLLLDATRARLAPLYDIASSLPHFDPSSRRVKFAMKIGAHYAVRDVSRHDWEKEARSLRIPSSRVFEKLAEMTRRLPSAATEVLERCREGGLTHPVLPRLQVLLEARCVEVARQLGLE